MCLIQKNTLNAMVTILSPNCSLGEKPQIKNSENLIFDNGESTNMAQKLN